MINMINHMIEPYSYDKPSATTLDTLNIKLDQLLAKSKTPIPIINTMIDPTTNRNIAKPKSNAKTTGPNNTPAGASNAKTYASAVRPSVKKIDYKTKRVIITPDQAIDNFDSKTYRNRVNQALKTAGVKNLMVTTVTKSISGQNIILCHDILARPSYLIWLATIPYLIRPR